MVLPVKTVVPPKKAKPASVASKELSVKPCQGKDALTVEEALDLIGWQIIDDENPATKGLAMHLKDVKGNKIRLCNNSTNRPFRPGLMKRYMNEVLRGKWRLNGETIIFDDQGKCQSGQHRLAGFIMAEQYRREQPERWKKYHKGPIKIECILVFGISHKPEVVDTIDQGQKRTFGDVIFRSELFGSGTTPLLFGGKGKAGEQTALPVMGPKLKQKLSNILAGATRLVWLRAGGKTVSDAPHFPVSEGLDFISDHPGLLEAVAYIYALEGGEGNAGQKISRFTTIAYASALYYMMSVSATDPDEWKEQGPAALDMKLQKKAKEFWAKFASGAELKANSPIHLARELLPKIDAGSAIGRDEIVATIIRAFNLWVDGKEVTAKHLSIKKTTSKTGHPMLAEEPRLGGIDIEGPEKPELGEFDVEAEEDDREGSRAGRKWNEGDTAWVKGTSDVPCWFGTIQEYIKAEKGAGDDMVMIEDDQGQVWEEKVGRLSLKYPG